MTDCFAERPPLQVIDPRVALNPEFVNFTGRKYGKLTVLGLCLRKIGNKPAKWLCQCTCGMYCTRTSKSLKVMERGGNSAVKMCGACYKKERPKFF